MKPHPSHFPLPQTLWLKRRVFVCISCLKGLLKRGRKCEWADERKSEIDTDKENFNNEDCYNERCPSKSSIMPRFKSLMSETYENILEPKNNFNNTVYEEQMWQSQLAHYRAASTLTCRQQQQKNSLP